VLFKDRNRLKGGEEYCPAVSQRQLWNLYYLLPTVMGILAQG